MIGGYEVTSNRESGHGRYDIAITPMTGTPRNYIFEFKKSSSMDKLKSDTLEGLKQIKV